MRARSRFTTVAVGGVLIAGLGLFTGPKIYEAFVSPPPIDPPTLMAEENALAAPATTSANSTSRAPVAQQPHAFDGVWVVASGSQADYHLSEPASDDALLSGSTHEISGELLLSDGTLQEIMFRVDVASIAAASSDENRVILETAMRSSEYPEAVFRLHRPVEVAALPDAGQSVECELTGELTIGGTTHFATFVANIMNINGGFELAGKIPVDLGDLVSDETAEVEFHLVLKRS